MEEQGNDLDRGGTPGCLFQLPSNEFHGGEGYVEHYDRDRISIGTRCILKKEEEELVGVRSYRDALHRKT